MGHGCRGFYDIVCTKPCVSYGLSAWIITFVGAQLIFMQVESLLAVRLLLCCGAVAAFDTLTVRGLHCCHHDYC